MSFESVFENVIAGVIYSILGAIAGTIFIKYKNSKINLRVLGLIFLSIVSFLIPIFSLARLWFLKEPPILIDFSISLFFLLSGLISGIIAIRLYIKEYRKSEIIESDWENEFEKFQKETNAHCEKEMEDALCEIRKTFHEIENVFDTCFVRAQCIDASLKNKVTFGCQESDKESTILESKIQEIYIKHLKETNYKENISVDIEIYGQNDYLKNQIINYRWILDTIDGGMHFIRDIPIFTTSIALQIKDNGNWVTKLGAIYIPTTKEIFFAIKGKGAYLNNWNCKLPLHRKEILTDSIFYIEFPNKSTKENVNFDKYKYKEACDLIIELFPRVKKIRGFNVGSFGLAYVAKGSFDAYISLAGNTSCYDSEAGKLLVEESAQASVTNSNGIVIKESMKSDGDFDLGSRIFASSTRIYNELKKDAVLNNLLSKLFQDFK